MPSVKKLCLNLFLASTSMTLVGSDALGKQNCRQVCAGSDNYMQCVRNCESPSTKPNKTEKIKPSTSGIDKGTSGINKSVLQKPCDPGYMWSPTNNRCVPAKASR